MKTLRPSIPSLPSVAAQATALAIALLAGESWAQPATGDAWVDTPAADDAGDDAVVADSATDAVELDDDEDAADAADAADAEESAEAESAKEREERLAADATNEQAEVEATRSGKRPPEVPGGRPSDPVAWAKPTQKTGDGFAFTFNGFIRAPMRIGIGKRDDPGEGQSATAFHYPVIPDDQYLSWQYSRQNPRDWAELFFTYGNDLAQATVAISAFQFTDAAWNEGDSQLGISQGYVKLTPDLGNGIDFWAKVGSIWDDYGSAGQWDAGQYDTYLFGRTAVMGETVHVGKTIDDVTYSFEQGFGTRRPDPSIYNTARFTLVHHEHAYINWRDEIELGAHYLYSWSTEEARDGTAPEDAALPDGSMSVAGVGLRLKSDEWGHLFLGYSRVNAENALTVGPAIEVINAAGGGQWNLGIVGNYFQGPRDRNNPDVIPPESESQGTGSIDSVEAQYEVAFGPEDRARLIVYGMFNSVTSDVEATNGITKLKYGLDASYSLLDWFGAGLRYDRLQPNSKIAEQSFSIISPRLIFRTSLVSHEEITLQYARYAYNERTCDDPTDRYQQKCVQIPSAPAGAEGFGALANYDSGTAAAPGPDPVRGAPTKRPDINVITLTASMWW